MKELPIGYLKIMTFNEKFNTFKNYDERFLNGTLPDSEFLSYFWSLKSLMFFYCKYIKYLYKKRGIFVQLPVEILHNAGRDGIITDSETWLEYIKGVNHCLSITDQDLRKKAMIKLLDNFRNRIQSMLILMHSPENNKFMEEKKAIYQEICNRELILPDNPVNYSCEDLLITEKSYKMLIDYFKSHPQINRVWIHGSRAYGTSHSTSDLDLLFDCDKTTWEKILNEFDNILIPYFIDGKNIYDKEREPLNKIAMYYGAKKIYDKKDFQIFWEDRKPFINNAIKIDMSKLI